MLAGYSDILTPLLFNPSVTPSQSEDRLPLHTAKMLVSAENYLTHMVKIMMTAPDVGGDSFTLGWDLAVSYSMSEINKLLAEEHGKSDSAMATDVDFGVSVRGCDGRRMTRNYHVELGPPEVVFQAASIPGGLPTCNMSMAIRGFYTTTDGRGRLGPRQHPIVDRDNPLIFTLSGISLGVVTGDCHPTERPAASRRFVPDPQTIRLVRAWPETKAPKTAWIVLHMPLDGAGVESPQVQAELSPIHDTATRDVERELRSFFLDPTKVDMLDYAIGSISSHESPHHCREAEILTPQSFRLVALAPSPPFPGGILTLLIRTSNGTDSGVQVGTQSAWQHLWERKLGLAPIPRTHMTSVLFHPELAFQVLVNSGKHDNYTASPVSDLEDPRGIDFTVTFQDTDTWNPFTYK